VYKARSTVDAASFNVTDALEGAKAEALAALEGAKAEALAALAGAMAEALAALVDAEASPEKNQSTVPISLVRSKLLFAEPVLAGMDCDSARLSDLIKQVKDKKINQPCNQWEMLETISNVHRLSDTYSDGWATVEECNKEMIAKALKICSDQRASLQELAKSINAASKNIKQQREKMLCCCSMCSIKATTGSKQDAGGQAPNLAAGAQARAPSSAKNQRAAAQAQPVFEFCTSYGTEARSFRTEAELSSAASRAGDLDFSKPWVLCGSESLLKSVSNERGVDSALSSFKSSWATSAIRASPGRGLQRLKDESTAAAARGIMAGNLSRHILPLSASAPELLASLASSIFAVAVGNEAAYVEKDAMPTLRLPADGSRLVCLIPITRASWYLEVDVSEPNCFTRISQALLAATRSQVQFMGQDLLYFALGPGDVLYTPTGYVVAKAAGINNGPRAGGKDVGG
jgi:hypothetical protein